MTDSYQAVYDAVRSRISGCDVSSVLQDAVRQAFDIGYAREAVSHELCAMALNISDAVSRPSVLMRPTLSKDGNQWCALYGENLQEGVAGFGDTPEQAMRAFDAAWVGKAMP